MENTLESLIIYALEMIYHLYEEGKIDYNTLLTHSRIKIEFLVKNPDNLEPAISLDAQIVIEKYAELMLKEAM